MNPKLEYIFGQESRGDSARERAVTSGRTFVRGQDHLSLDRTEAKGRRLTAAEALDAYGLDLLEEALDYGSAILRAPTRGAPTCRWARRGGPCARPRRERV